MSVELLEAQAERCIRLARECRTKNAETVMRLLAVDLMLAAEAHRNRSNPTPRQPRSQIAADSENFAELEHVMQAVTFMRLTDAVAAARSEPVPAA